MRFFISIKNLGQYLKATKILSEKLMLPPGIWKAADCFFLKDGNFVTSVWDALVITEKRVVVAGSMSDCRGDECRTLTFEALETFNALILRFDEAKYKGLLDTPFHESMQCHTSSPQLSAQIRNALKENNIYTARKLSEHTRSEIVELTGVKEEDLSYVEKILTQRGLSFLPALVPQD